MLPGTKRAPWCRGEVAWAFSAGSLTCFQKPMKSWTNWGSHGISTVARLLWPSIGSKTLLWVQARQPTGPKDDDTPPACSGHDTNTKRVHARHGTCVLSWPCAAPYRCCRLLPAGVRVSGCLEDRSRWLYLKCQISLSIPFREKAVK